MKNQIRKRIKSTINILKHLTHKHPEETELLEEQIASLEQVLKDEE